MSLKDHQNPNGTYNGVSALSEISGLSEAEISATMENIKANNLRLERCQYHEFAINPDLSNPDSPVVRHLKYKCIHCGGTINPTAWRWFELGRQQQRK